MGEKKSKPVRNIKENKKSKIREKMENVSSISLFSLFPGKNLKKVEVIPKQDKNIRNEAAEIKTAPTPTSSIE